MYNTCNGWPHRHGHRHHAQQETNGLRHILGSHELEGDGSHDADKAAIKKAHEKTNGDEPAEDSAERDHHGHESNHQERGYLVVRRIQRMDLVLNPFNPMLFMSFLNVKFSPQYNLQLLQLFICII